MAEKRWPDCVFKKPKLQHEYDALKDAGRALFHLTHSSSHQEMDEWANKLQGILEERGQIVVIAEKEGWGVAFQLHEDVGTFLDDRKQKVKEARKKAKKKTPSGKFFPSSSTSYLQRSWSNPFQAAGDSQRNFPRTGKPSNQQAPSHVKCWSCQGNHYHSQCSNNNKGSN